MVSQEFGNSEDEIGGSGADRQSPYQFHTDDLGYEHEIGLAEHDGLGFDSADAPPHDSQTVDHCRVRVGTDERVRVGGQFSVLFPELDHRRQVLEVDLVDDPSARWYHPEVVERLLRELEELIAFTVPREFEVHILAEGRAGAGCPDSSQCP